MYVVIRNTTFTLWSGINIKTMLTTMNETISVESEESENSIIELEIPRKPTPPLVLLEDEDIILNVMQENREVLLAKDIIDNDKDLSEVSKRKISSDNKNCPNHWTKDMIQFYNDDWGGEENFVVDKIQEKMDKTPSLWKVFRKDTFGVDNRYWKKQVKCWNCNQRGHHSISCPEKSYTPKCFMCGIEGHVGYNCPNSICLNCGRASREYVVCCYICRNHQQDVCSRCHVVGHNFIDCPDHWRLFHLTTGTTSVKVPDRNIYKSNSRIWCCNCGKQGHYQFNCSRRKDVGGFMDTLPYVVSYQKAFNDTQPKSNGVISKSKRRRMRRKKRKEEKSEKILKLNPLHTTFKKDKTNLKNKLEKLKKAKALRSGEIVTSEVKKPNEGKGMEKESECFWKDLVL